MVGETKKTAGTWIWAEDERDTESTRPFEFSLIRSEDNVRVVLVMLLLITALTTPTIITNRVAAYTSLIIGVFLTLWTRYAADWLQLRREGQLGAGAVVIVLADFVWLALLVMGTGGADSPFDALLLVPILFSVALFSRLRVAVMLVTALVVVAYVGLTVSSGVGPEGPWHLSGMLLTIMALAWLAYGMCLVLERERRANELVIRHMTEVVLLLDTAGRVILCNQQLEQLTGVPPGEVVGGRVEDIARVGSLENVALLLADVDPAAMETGPTVRECEMTVAGAETLDLRISTLSCASPTGNPVGWVVICQDITPVKSVLRLKESGISMLSHEIRSPLTTLKVTASMLSALAEKTSDDKESRFAEVIQTQTEHVLKLAGELINISALEDTGCSLDSKETDIAALVRNARRVAELRGSGKGIAVSMELVGPLPVFYGDEHRLADALQRLCDNAIKYTDADGEVRIRAARDNGWVCISVSDTGKGIPSEQWERIFQKFVQLEDDTDKGKSERGAGLGLYVVQRVAQLHGGRVEVESELGNGSTFTVRLPVGDEAPRATAGSGSEVAARTTRG